MMISFNQLGSLFLYTLTKTYLGLISGIVKVMNFSAVSILQDL